MASGLTFGRPRSWLVVLYLVLGVVSFFAPGSQLYMVIGAVVADLLALLLVNLLYQSLTGQKDADDLGAQNGCFMLIGGLVIMSVYVMLATIVYRIVHRTDLTMDVVNGLLRTNAFPLTAVVLSAGVAYWLDLENLRKGKDGSAMLFGLITRRMFMLLGFSVLCTILAFPLSKLNPQVMLCILFAFRALVEWWSRRVWRRKFGL